MAVPLDNPEDSGGIEIAKGAKGRVVEILKVEDLSNYPGKDTHYKIAEGSEFEPQLCVKLWYQGATKERNITLLGNFKRNDNNKVIGWDKFNNGVLFFLYKFYPTDAVIDDANGYSIIPSFLARLVGKKIIVVNYIVNGTYQNDKGETKHSWRDWNKVFPDGTDINEIQSQFAAATTWLTKPSGKKTIENCYNPALIDEYKSDNDGTDFNYGANETTAPPSDEDIF